MAYLFTEILIISWHTDIKEALWKKTRAIKLKIQEKYIIFTSLLIFSPEFNQERELSNSSVLFSHTWIKT